MFPDPKSDTSGRSEPGIGVGVPLSGSFNLVPPPLCIRFRPSSVLKATVPEAPVHEYGNPLCPENDVCPTTQAGHGSNADPVSEAMTV